MRRTEQQHVPVHGAIVMRLCYSEPIKHNAFTLQLRAALCPLLHLPLLSIAHRLATVQFVVIAGVLFLVVVHRMECGWTSSGCEGPYMPFLQCGFFKATCTRHQFT